MAQRRESRMIQAELRLLAQERRRQTKLARKQAEARRASQAFDSLTWLRKQKEMSDEHR
jgi:hypothetical protein